jgi:hypothetical protein
MFLNAGIQLALQGEKPSHNRQICFQDLADRATYAMYLSRYQRKFEVDVHAWVLMNNHTPTGYAEHGHRTL